MYTWPLRSRAFVLASVCLLGLAVACTSSPLPPIAGPGTPLTGINPEVATTPGARTAVVSYGPWTVPGATGPGHAGAGMLNNNVAVAVAKPCSNCYVTTFKPQLTYADGTVANTDTGLWLHHFQFYVFGRNDPSCVPPYPINLLGEHIFGGGNERTRARFPAGAGVKVGATDVWNLIYDIMNTGPEAKQVKLEMTYEWVPASTPNMHGARALYLDASPRCSDSPLPNGPGSFTHERTFAAPLSGRVVGLAGHLHDGGRRLTLRNATSGQLICDAAGGYGGPGYEEAEGGHDHTGHGGYTVHLSSVGQCVSPSIDRPIASLKPGDQLTIAASYENPDDPSFGSAEEVMGVFFMYVLQE